MKKIIQAIVFILLTALYTYILAFFILFLVAYSTGGSYLNVIVVLSHALIQFGLLIMKFKNFKPVIYFYQLLIFCLYLVIFVFVLDL